jgi:hypothetical protein
MSCFRARVLQQKLAGYCRDDEDEALTAVVDCDQMRTLAREEDRAVGEDLSGVEGALGHFGAS